MNRLEFLKKCQPYNKMYHEFFGEIPIHTEYVATYDEYYLALQKAVMEKVKLDTILEKIEKPDEEGAKYN